MDPIEFFIHTPHNEKEDETETTDSIESTSQVAEVLEPEIKDIAKSEEAGGSIYLNIA